MSDVKSDLSKAASDAGQSAIRAESRFLATLQHNWYWLFAGGTVAGFVLGHFV